MTDGIRRLHSLTPTDGPSEWRLEDGAERPAVGLNEGLKRLLWVVSQTRKSPNILARKLRQNLGKELSIFRENASVRGLQIRRTGLLEYTW